MKMIVGLGNPGKKYEDTRHNVGFMVINELNERFNGSFKVTKYNGEVSTIVHKGEKVLLVKPLTYMNESGQCIRQLADYYEIPTDDIVIVYDDLDLPVGQLRLRQKGSAGGHNGIKSTIQHLGTQDFKRVKVGITRPDDGNIINWVLGRFSKKEQPDVAISIKEAADALEMWLTADFIQAMNRYNQAAK
ncbi:aminoacyl-tRNA hydrolase [Brochothrix thermosphacta]|uniref:Peptidyl-tRNA hydrolase n=1 Tax=Brochothrix thermosphacta TaxID=2756 RepID=A0A1D2L0H7_BROTH|nr:aminoacyl-tRNA hydrolase [Brochothrix thermosphacta]ANZ95091.1 aminoacyl-tRNA hydrolase [Brochothrix thermosphacta]ANZ96605.1 aminoacyl-tRNA hydrolase [Brochothrix thermosphacta]ATF26024.1 aminoacyl-tRNA hydrolase [Brochothrix thermosphacta]ATH85364.1 aminoacyl-tRNA hydrolase [Brochothrix thermosphacta]EUJ34382.1 peptidyl-tRNA hydrolase [Brochothrix thermosphacta DSM 20171 = FSL F6-1036]